MNRLLDLALSLDRDESATGVARDGHLPHLTFDEVRGAVAHPAELG